MRTVSQIKLVGHNYRLNTQRMSVLLHVRKQLTSQEHLKAVALDLKRAPDGLVHRILNNLVAPVVEHGVKSSWGAMIPMVQK